MAYFREEERLISLSQDLHEKQTIENGINRHVIPVASISALVEAIEVESGRTDRLHIIVSSTMGGIFQQHLSELVAGVGSLVEAGRAQVFEIGVGKVFKDALTFADVTSFIAFCRENERRSYMEFLETKGTEEQQAESRILRELTIERDAVTEREALLKEELARTKVELSEAESNYQALETKVNHVYVIDLENAKTKLEMQLEEQQENERLYKLEKAKVAEYEGESSRYRTENKSLQMDNASLKQMMEEYRVQIRGLQSQIRALEQDIVTAEREKVDILKSRVDAEVHVQLTRQLETERAALRKVNTDMHRVETESRKKDFELAEREREITELRQGGEDTQGGRTTKLDAIQFKSTNVYYVKVITPLPYLNSALECLYEKIKERDGGRTHVCVLKHDDGLNDVLFKGFELYGTLGDVSAKHERFLLYPSRRMFTAGERFDANVTSVLVLDYIQSKDYYMTTEGFQRIMTVCQNSSMIHTLDLKGTPISLDSGSKLDIKFDARINSATTKEMQMRYIQMKVDTWLKNLDIT